MSAPASVIAGRSVALPYYARLDLADTNEGVVAPFPAGLVTLHHCAEGLLEIPQAITFTWVTSAVVANRSLGVRFDDADGNVTGQILCNGVQPASTSFRYTFMLDAGGSFVSGIFGLAPLPFRFLKAGDSWRVIGTNLDVGDVQSGLTHLEVRIPTGPELASPLPPPVVPIGLT